MAGQQLIIYTTLNKMATVFINNIKVKVKIVYRPIAFDANPPHSYGVSLSIWDHTVLPATPALTPAIQAGTRLTYPVGMEGRVDLGDLLHTEMVYPQSTLTCI